MRIVWTDPAVSDIEAIHSYISHDSEIYADVVISDIFDSVDRLGKFPKSGRKVPELDDENTREVITGNYRIIYDIRKDYIRILAVFHDARIFRDPR